jgi:hypothetical protein
MALFAWNDMDLKGFVMLGTNASRMLDLLGFRRGRLDIGVNEVGGVSNEVEMAARMADMFELSIGEILGMQAAGCERYACHQRIS